MKRQFLFLAMGYALVSFIFLLFSYTQVDLSLTLSRVSFVQTVQKGFQYIGFYQRPVATALYLGILSGLFVLYGWCLSLAKKNTMTNKNLWILVLIVSSLLFFSYSAAFSYDIFNYIFTAKTILLYGQNPYLVKPLQFAGIDSMLSFMRWTHLPSAYTPLWIGLTIPAYIISFGSLLFGLWMMKIAPVLFYFLTIWSIGRILDQYEPKRQILGMAAFALNPLVLVEILISGHNDSVMMGLALFAFFLAIKKQKQLSMLTLSLSVATKFMTIFLIPLHFIGWNRTRAFGLMILGLVIVLLRREFLPWYFLWILPFGVLFPRRIDLLFVLSGFSCGLLFRYAPVLYYGMYDPPVPQVQTIVFIVPIIASIIGAGMWNLIGSRRGE